MMSPNRLSPKAVWDINFRTLVFSITIKLVDAWPDGKDENNSYKKTA